MIKRPLISYSIFVGIFLFLIMYSIVNKVYAYTNDSLVFIALLTIALIFYKKLNLNKVIFIVLGIAMLLHNLGVFGFYAHTPILIQYDHVTHLVGMFAVSIFLYNYLEKKKLSKVTLILLVFLATLGVGALIEQIEFTGYLSLGKGEGLFYFGGTGDTGVSGLIEQNLQDIDELGGGFLNTMWDLMYNFFGAVIGIGISVIRQVRNQKI